jgi:hypothetical protein
VHQQGVGGVVHEQVVREEDLLTEPTAHQPRGRGIGHDQAATGPPHHLEPLLG